MVKIKSDHNQSLGYKQEKNSGHNLREYEEFKKKKTRVDYDNQKDKEDTALREVTTNWAKDYLISNNIVKTVHEVLGAGKEATVLLTENKVNKLICAKVFRYYTSTNRKRLKSIIDPHVRLDHMATIVAKQEYNNLETMYEAGIPVPKPIILRGNIFLMEYISYDEKGSIPAPLLLEVDLIDNGFDPEDMLYESVDILANMFLKTQYIHGDYSEHNLMLTKNGLITMDVSQSIQYNIKTFVDTPTRIRIDKALKYLETDIKNITRYFAKKYRVSVPIKEVVDEIKSDLPENVQKLIKLDFHNEINAFNNTRLPQSHVSAMSTGDYDLNNLRQKFINQNE